MSDTDRDDLSYDLYQRLIDLRKNLGISQAQAAREMGLSINALNNYERNVRLPNREAMKKLCDYYRVTYDYLLTGQDEPDDELSPNTRILLQTLRGATEEEIAQAIKIVEALKK